MWIISNVDLVTYEPEYVRGIFFDKEGKPTAWSYTDNPVNAFKFDKENEAMKARDFINAFYGDDIGEVMHVDN